MSLKPGSIRLLGKRVLVKRYLLPETINGIIVPETHRNDKTLSLWELVSWSPAALTTIQETLGQEVELEEGDFLQTRPWRGVPIGDDHFIIDAHEVMNVIKW